MLKLKSIITALIWEDFMVKKKLLYDESPEVPQERLDEESDDLLRLNKASIGRRYVAIRKKYDKDVQRQKISSAQANTLAMCELISENNANLLTLIEHQFEIKFLS